MNTTKIFIASSGRTLLLAEKLREELQTSEICDAILWTEGGRRQPGPTIIEMLETSADNYDFALMILSKDDIIVRETGDALRARDNCIFEAGLFVAALGRERCYLASSVERSDLPSDLGGIVFLPFEEPTDLTDPEACTQAIRGMSDALKHAMQRTGQSMREQRVPLLSVDEVFKRESPHSDGGDLREGQVVVCDVQPFSRPELAIKIRRNLDCGISYLYFLHNTDDTIAKTIQALQVIAIAGLIGPERAIDFAVRMETVEKEKIRVLDALREICEMQTLLVSFFPDEPQFRFRLHNASDPDLARLYMKFRGRGFMPWAEGNDAVKISRTLPRYMPSNEEKRLFVPLTTTTFKGKERQRFHDSVDRALIQYFPGMSGEVKELCYGKGAIVNAGRSASTEG